MFATLNNKRIAINIVIFFILNGCTTIGFHDSELRNSMDWGKNRIIKVCTFYEPGISQKDIDDLFTYWNDELQLYSITAISLNHQEVERPGLTGGSILEFLYTLPMTNECDRYLYLKGRNWKDLVFEFFSLGIFAAVGIKLEIQGAVETQTHTRGYIKAKYISLLQLLFTSPKSTLVHEGYHLLGCGHQLFLDPCYKRIQNTKYLAVRIETESIKKNNSDLQTTDESNHSSFESKEDMNQQILEKLFFPSITESGRQFTTRDQVDRKILNK